MFKNKILVIVPLLLISLFYNSSWDYNWTIQLYPLLFQAIVSITLLFVVLLIPKQGHMFRLTQIDYLVIAYYSYSILISVWNNGNIKYDTAIATLFSYLLLYLCIRIIVRDENDNISLFYLLLSFGVLNCFIGTLQVLGLISLNSLAYNLTGTFLNPGPFGGYVCFLIPISIFFIFSQKKISQKILAITLFLWLGASLILSESRAAMLACIIAASILFLYRIWPKTRSYRIITITGFCIAISLSFILLYKLRPASADGRLLIWKITTTMFDESFMMGKGVGYFNDEYNLYQARYFSSDHVNIKEALLAGSVHSPFNDFLKILIEFGGVGFLLFILIIWTILIDLFSKKLSWLKLVNFCCLVCFLVFGMYSYPMQITALHTLLIMAMAMCSRSCDLKIIRLHKFNPYLRNLMLLGILTFMIYVYEAYKEITKWRSANNSISYNLAYSLKTYNDVYPNLINSFTFLYNYGAELADLGYYRKAILVFEQLKLSHHDRHLYIQLGRCYESTQSYALAEKSYQIASSMEPILLRPQVMLFEMFKISGQKEKAKIQANKILNTPIKIQTKEAEAIRKETRMYLIEHNESKN